MSKEEWVLNCMEVVKKPHVFEIHCICMFCWSISNCEGVWRGGIFWDVSSVIHFDGGFLSNCEICGHGNTNMTLTVIVVVFEIL